MYILFIIGVLYMAHFKNNIVQHLSSAKGWLTKAEEAFDKEKDIRGELNLMLAQAELQHVKEVSRSNHWRHKYAAVRHGVALVCAVVMAAGLGGVYWWTSKPQVVVPVPLAEKVSLPVESKIQSSSKTGQVPSVPLAQEESSVVRKEAAPPVEAVTASSVTSQKKKAELSQQEEPSVAISPDEMQKLMRAAGKSLRGQ
jgi:hypothetical protein